MPPARKHSSINKHALARWLKAHQDDHGAEVAAARLEWSELEGQGRLLRDLVGLTQVRPDVLVTSQVSGRWSTTRPPLGGLKTKVLFKLCRPPDGNYWLSGDWQAVESWLAALYSQEERDLKPLMMGYDLHCATASDIFGRQVGKDEVERQLAKTTRYNLQYAYDHRGILDAKDIGIFGGRDEALRFAARYIESRPALSLAKQRVFADSVRTGEARSAFGRLRRLTGDERTKAKDGWSQVIQGTVSSMMNRAIVRICSELGAKLVFNRHDGSVFQFPLSADVYEMYERCEAIFKGPWQVWNTEFHAPSDWHVECA
jgi:DNA polymerase I-like protein with 3'-5' exonuclease and polymerase domains